MSAYDFPIPQIPMESLRHIAEVSAKLSDSLISSGLLNVCESAHQMLAASTAVSCEASQIVAQALQPLLDRLAKLADELPSTADTLQSLADKIDDSVLDETSAAIEEALPYMEPEAQEYCVTEALPKLAPEARQKLSLSKLLAIIEALLTIAGFAHDLYRDKHPVQCSHDMNPAIIQQAEASDDRLQSADDSILIFDDGSQAGDGPRKETDPAGQDDAADSLDDGVD